MDGDRPERRLYAVARLLAAYASCGGYGLEPLVFPEADTPATTTT